MTAPTPDLNEFLVQVVAVEPPAVSTFRPRPDGTCAACGRPECDHDRRHDLPGAPAYCLVQPSTVAVLHAFTLPGEPVRVAAEPRQAAEIADRLAADGHPCYAMVERWQIIGPPEPGELWLCRLCGTLHHATNPPTCLPGDDWNTWRDANIPGGASSTPAPPTVRASCPQ